MLTASMQRLTGATAVRFVSNGKVLAYAELATPAGTVRIIDTPDMAEAIADAINAVLAKRNIIAAAEAAEAAE